MARALGIVIMSYFWCSSQGKECCDSHFAVGKCMDVPLLLAGGQQMGAKDFVEMNNRHLLGTTPQVVPIR